MDAMSDAIEGADVMLYTVSLVCESRSNIPTERFFPVASFMP
jgi:hypothetical protein